MIDQAWRDAPRNVVTMLMRMLPSYGHWTGMGLPALHRRCRLLACAFYRLKFIAAPLDNAVRRKMAETVEYAEDVADGMAELQKGESLGWPALRPDAADAVVDCARAARRPCGGKKTGEAALRRALREVFPWLGKQDYADAAALHTLAGADAVAMAHAAYEERMPDGRLDPARLLVLSDAVEESGHGHKAAIALRIYGPKFRGFWVIDALTGRMGGVK